MNGFRGEPAAGKVHKLTMVFKLLKAKGLVNNLQGFPHLPFSIVEGDSESLQFTYVVAAPYSQVGPTIREDIKSCYLLRHSDRVVKGKGEKRDQGPKADPAGLGGDVTEDYLRRGW